MKFALGGYVLDSSEQQLILQLTHANNCSWLVC